jgi:(4S)-4-hydroxy-5-phosphonooxypentane-2,3-dione isomerase
MFVVVVFIEAKRQYRMALKAALMVHARRTLENETRCQRFDVAEDPLDPLSFLLYEIYDSEAAFRAHREMPHYSEHALAVQPWTESKRVLTYDLLNGHSAN